MGIVERRLFRRTFEGCKAPLCIFSLSVLGRRARHVHTKFNPRVGLYCTVGTGPFLAKCVTR